MQSWTETVRYTVPYSSYDHTQTALNSLLALPSGLRFPRSLSSLPQSLALPFVVSLARTFSGRCHHRAIGHDG
jgi:hypothetical protein